MAHRDELTAEYVRRILDYDPETGEFRWRWRDDVAINVNARFAGNVAGRISRTGYRQIQINGRLYQSHRIAWLFVAGSWPADQIDHINLDNADNRFCNLREATRSQNSAHIRAYASNVTGFKGVTKHKRAGFFRATIKKNGKQLHLGIFATPEDAHEAYCRAARNYHGEFARAG